MENENPQRTLGDYSKPSHEGYRNTIEILDRKNVVPLRPDTIRLVQNGCSFHGLRYEDPNQHLKDFLKLVDSLDLNGDNKERTRQSLFNFPFELKLAIGLSVSPRNASPLGRISLTVSLLNSFHHTSDRRLIELENQVQCLMEAHLDPNQPIQVNKIASSCEICSGPHDTQYCMENPKHAFVEYASSRTDKARDARITRFKYDFKQNQSEITNKLDTLLKASNDRMTGALPSNTVKNPKLNPNSTSSARSYLMGDPQSSSNLFKSVNAFQTCFKSTTNIQKDQLQVNTLMVNEIETPKPEEPKESIEYEFADLHLNLPVLEVLAHVPIYDALLDKYMLKIGLLEETKDVLGLADETKSYPVGIMKNVEVHVGKLRLFEDFHVVDIEREPTFPLLVGRGFLATTNVAIDCKKAKIAV
ncbi:MAK10-like protein [Tanacetum coccineum]